MNTYQRQLLDKLITELTDNASLNLHTAQMLAAELKGVMQAQTELDDIHPITCDCAECVPLQPTPDADGWIENTGVMPECEVVEIRFRGAAHGFEISPSSKYRYRWHFATSCQSTSADITHYKPV